MTKRERMLRKIEVALDQSKRMMMLAMFVSDYGTANQKNHL
ncbi:MAG: hypothetical protein ACOYOS_22575 [Syntrophales bacterium]